ncbi:MAG: SAM-dependent methyltransferase [Planctomycetaceae bacterium]|nr:SAM-dependent methyltransferase [Planctomycetaceae bacterium]
MNAESTDTDRLNELLRESLREQTTRHIVFSSPVVKTAELPSRLDVRPVSIRGRTMWQLAKRIGTQEHHENVSTEDAVALVQQLGGSSFREVRLRTASDEWSAKFDRRGQCRLRHAGSRSASQANLQHDRQRQHIFPDGTPVPFLMATGVMSEAGQVYSAQYHKFRQINRYVEFIRDIIEHLPAEGPIRVVDFGCGKSYLSFATHYFLQQVMQRETDLTGLDRRSDIVQRCREISNQLKLSGIHFETGDICNYQPSEHIHLTISLHACDTATDDAVAVAVARQSDVILAAPCCQHELAAALPKTQFPLLSSHGILHERFSSLATDAVRAAVLECVGYDTRVMEFIELEHTPKNLLIRAIRRSTDRSEEAAKHRRQQLHEFVQQLGVPELQLQRRLRESGIFFSED